MKKKQIYCSNFLNVEMAVGVLMATRNQFQRVGPATKNAPLLCFYLGNGFQKVTRQLPDQIVSEKI